MGVGVGVGGGGFDSIRLCQLELLFRTGNTVTWVLFQACILNMTQIDNSDRKQKRSFLFPRERD